MGLHIGMCPRCALVPLTSYPLHTWTWKERGGEGWKSLLGTGSSPGHPPLLPPPAPNPASNLSHGRSRDGAGSRSRAKVEPKPLPNALAPHPSREMLPNAQGRAAPALTGCHPTAPAASRPLAAPSGGPHPGPGGRSPHRDCPGPWCAWFCGGQGQGHEPRHRPPTRAGARGAPGLLHPPVVLDLLLDLGHHHLLGFKEGGSDIIPIPQPGLWHGRGAAVSQQARKGTRDLLDGAWSKLLLWKLSLPTEGLELDEL